MSAASRLQQKIHATIPLSQAMQFSILALGADSIRVSAPLPPNVNIHGTAFAGSLYSVAVLSGWALCAHLLDELDVDAELVVARAEIRYRAPVTGDIECACDADADQRAEFEHGIREQGKGKMTLEVMVGDASQAVLQATYVALAHSS